MKPRPKQIVIPRERYTVVYHDENVVRHEWNMTFKQMYSANLIINWREGPIQKSRWAEFKPGAPATIDTLGELIEWVSEWSP